MMQKIWEWMFWKALRHIQYKSVCSVSDGRVVVMFVSRGVQVKVTHLDRHKLPIYTREELVTMMMAIRRCERVLNWKVPE
jgi:hypothetical protein